MQTRYVFVDESGDMGTSKDSSSHVVIAALILPHPLILDKIVKKMRRSKFQTELSAVHEIKAIHSSLSIKEHMISRLNEIQNANIIFVGLNKKMYLTSHPGGTFWMIYQEAINKFITSLVPRFNYDIKIDKTFTAKQFVSIKETFLSNELLKNHVSISQAYSFNWSGLQFADLLAWIFYRYLERGEKSYINLLALPFTQIL